MTQDVVPIHQSGILIFHEKSVFFSFQSPKPTNQPTNFSNFLRIPRNRQDKLVPSRFFKMVDKPHIVVRSVYRLNSALNQ